MPLTSNSYLNLFSEFLIFRSLECHLLVLISVDLMVTQLMNFVLDGTYFLVNHISGSKLVHFIHSHEIMILIMEIHKKSILLEIIQTL